MIEIVYNVLASPVNLGIWDKSKFAIFPRCPERGLLEHILNSCPTALGIAATAGSMTKC